MRVSVIIKTLNEAANIGRAIESALAAVKEVGSGEVIVADSLSVDSTIEIAKDYPVKIVQLIDPVDRCCGVGAQLGFMVAQGQYLYILDGDMELEPGFLLQAVAELDVDSSLAGVGGLVREMNLQGQEFIRRAEKRSSHMQPGLVDRLDMGGLYRNLAMKQIGYFTNRNLHAYEEFELAARLSVKGWKLRRLNIYGVKHYGHTDASFSLLTRRWRSRYAWGSGELLRQSWNTPHRIFVISRLAVYRLYVAVVAWWFSLIALMGLSVFTPMLGSALLLIVIILPLAAMTFRKRSLNRAVYSVAAWNVFTAGLVAGAVSKPRCDPLDLPDCRSFIS